MKDEIQSYIQKYSEDIQTIFIEIRDLIFHSVPGEIDERLWAQLPSFYLGEQFIRVIPFKDHVNIEATAIVEYKQQLEQFKITPKGMLQIYLNQDIPHNVLKRIFNIALLG